MTTVIDAGPEGGTPQTVAIRVLEGRETEVVADDQEDADRSAAMGRTARGRRAPR
jgi:hypothetical protein